MIQKAAWNGLVVWIGLWVCASVLGADARHRSIADEAIDRGLAFLRTTQNDDGSWSPGPGPAVTAIVVWAMLDRPGVSSNDPAVGRAVAFILSRCRPDGGIHDGFLENYNTAICLSALSRLSDRPGVASAIQKAQDYLRNLQWHDQPDPQGRAVDMTHPYFGGAGYGRHGRPDLSNTQIMLEGLYDSGLDRHDPAFQRALVFITRCQGSGANHDFGDKIVPDGGFIYATSLDKDHIGTPQSMAGSKPIEPGEAGERVGPLRTYGSMTYAGFKSYIYADLRRDDRRVLDAYDWIRGHYTLDHNPGLPGGQEMQGYYYYLVTFAKAMDAWGQRRIVTADGLEHDWANDLISKLAGLQRPDGSWANGADRWMEGDANLTTGYALTALVYATR